MTNRSPYWRYELNLHWLRNLFFLILSGNIFINHHVENYFNCKFWRRGWIIIRRISKKWYTHFQCNRKSTSNTKLCGRPIKFTPSNWKNLTYVEYRSDIKSVRKRNPKVKKKFKEILAFLSISANLKEEKRETTPEGTERRYEKTDVLRRCIW